MVHGQVYCIKHVTHYGPRSGLLYYNLTTLIERDSYPSFVGWVLGTINHMHLFLFSTS